MYSLFTANPRFSPVDAGKHRLVAQRTREIGIRIALGAQRGDFLKLVFQQGMALVVVDVLLGLAASIGLTRLMATLLDGVSAADPITFVAYRRHYFPWRCWLAGYPHDAVAPSSTRSPAR